MKKLFKALICLTAVFAVCSGVTHAKNDANLPKFSYILRDGELTVSTMGEKIINREGENLSIYIVLYDGGVLKGVKIYRLDDSISEEAPEDVVFDVKGYKHISVRAFIWTSITNKPIEEPYFVREFGPVTEKSIAVAALADRLESYRNDIYVYRDYNDPVNHYTQRARVGDWSVLDENCKEDPHSGNTCIRCSQEISNGSWTGWMFLNGYKKKDGSVGPNKGDEPGQGMDLSGAKELHFFARGKYGGEVAEFYTAGFTDGAYHDTAARRDLGQITLTNEWKEYVIPLDGVDMSYICNGFGYVTKDRKSVV